MDGHVWMWELDYKESWAPNNWCFWTVVLEKTLESPLNCKEIQPVYPKGNQSWVFTERTDVEAETPILWPPDVKSWFIGKDSDAVKDWRQEEKGTTEGEMVGWHHRHNGFGWTLGVGDVQGGRVGHDWATELNWTSAVVLLTLFIFLSLYHRCSASILMILDLRVLLHVLISLGNNNRLHHWLFLLLCSPLFLPDISPLSTIYFHHHIPFLLCVFQISLRTVAQHGCPDLCWAFLFKG